MLRATLGLSHLELELEWHFSKHRGFIAALAQHRTVIRFDRPRTGLPDRQPGDRELAALLPDAQLVTLEGEMHPPWPGDRAMVLGAITPFLDPPGGRPRQHEPDVAPGTGRHHGENSRHCHQFSPHDRR